MAVIKAGIELVDESEGRSPLSQAAAVREKGEAVARTVPATIAGERRMMRVVEVPLGDTGVAGYAIDVEDREQARADLARFVRAQRDMLDRLSAGVAQFGRDRSLIFSNQPFARLFSLKPDFLVRFAGVQSRPRQHARERQPARGARLSRLEARARPLVHLRRRRQRGGLAAARRQASARRRPAAPGRRPAADLRGSHRADPARQRPRHPAARAHRDLRQSVRGDRRVRFRRPPAPVEQPLPRGLAVRGGAARRPSPRRRDDSAHRPRR